MNDDQARQRIERLFQEAVSLPPDDRDRFLGDHCQSDSERGEIEKLLKYDAAAGGGLSGDDDERLLPTQDVLKSSPGRAARPMSGSSIDHGQFVPGTVLANRYRIVGMLGKGGMGEVYRADDLELGQSVALKFLPNRLAEDPRALERFRGEVRLARQVSHPNVCRVYDIGQMGGQWFLSMEYVDGEDLAQLLTRIGRFNTERATELARQLCMGLHAAHEKGVLHRDLKPANIMIDGRGKLLITDFGLAEIADEVRDDDIRSGTPAYMSPEQLAGREVTEKSDIYSLGIILHEIYTGKPVWEAASMAELLEKRNSGTAPTPSSHVSELDPLVDRVIERCLEPDPEKRPASALNVIASLPGGDPLAAALGAGELPSPEMVAAAGDNTRIDLRLAVLALFGVAISLFMVCWLEEETSTVNQSGLKLEPEVLRNEVRNFVSDDLGYSEEPGEMIDGFNLLSDINPEATSYWYRQRPAGDRFKMRTFWSSSWAQVSWARPDFFAPSFQNPGEIAVVLSGSGQLQYFRATPQVERFTDSEVSEPDWSKWLPTERIGCYLPDVVRETPQELLASAALPTVERVEDYWWTPPDAFDSIGVWRGEDPDDGTAFFIEAAAFRGKLTYYRKTTEGQSIPVRREYRQRELALLIYAVLLVFGSFVAWRNVRSGRVDQSGAVRLAAYIMMIHLVVLFGYCRLTLDLESLVGGVLTMGFAQAIFHAARDTIWYLAIEPYVRKIWPQILITSSRLLDGRLRDPLVGRDLLVGALAGTLGTVVWRANALVQSRMEGEVWSGLGDTNDLPLSGAMEAIATVFAAHGLSFFIATFLLLCLMMCRVALRSEFRGFIAASALVTLFLISAHGGNWLITSVASLINAVLFLFILIRFGIFAVIASMTFRIALDWSPLTLDSRNWYFDNGIAVVLLITVSSLIGFYLAVSNQPKVARLNT
jgi:serine/threonine-protein kinase